MKRKPCKYRVHVYTTAADGTESKRATVCCSRKAGIMLKHFKCANCDDATSRSQMAHQKTEGRNASD